MGPPMSISDPLTAFGEMIKTQNEKVIIATIGK